MTLSIEDRFFAKVRPSGVCWEWTAAIGTHGYGVFQLGRKAGTTLAHRWSYEFLTKETLGEAHLDHWCRNRRCVDPDHLEPVTNKINSLRGNSPAANNARKKACPRCGGPYSPQIVRGVPYARICLACDKLQKWKSADLQRHVGENR